MNSFSENCVKSYSSSTIGLISASSSGLIPLDTPPGMHHTRCVNRPPMICWIRCACARDLITLPPISRPTLATTPRMFLVAGSDVGPQTKSGAASA